MISIICFIGLKTLFMNTSFSYHFQYVIKDKLISNVQL